MTNSITATIAFDFKGKRYTPSTLIEIDVYMQSLGKLPDFHGLIAAENNIGIYSYEYEMLLAEDIIITDAQGMIKEYILDGVLDAENFESAWLEYHALQTVQAVVEQNGLSEKLFKDPEIKKCLLEIYKLGKSK